MEALWWALERVAAWPASLAWMPEPSLAALALSGPIFYRRLMTASPLPRADIPARLATYDQVLHDADDVARAADRERLARPIADGTEDDELLITPLPSRLRFGKRGCSDDEHSDGEQARGGMPHGALLPHSYAMRSPPRPYAGTCS